MKVSPSKLNVLLLFKLPAAYFTGVRVTYLDSDKCIASVKYRWINQNPFKSIYWAVQGMAAELTTGALIMSKIRQGNLDVSMLLVGNRATFIKRSRGRITFTCNDGELADEAIATAIETGEGETVEMKAVGIDEEGFEASNFTFEWAIKVRN